MVVSSYAGWGVAGTNILFRPSAILTVDKPALATATTTPPAGLQAPPSPQSFSSSDENSSWKFVVGISVGVGGALALAAVMAGTLLWSRWVLHLQYMHDPSGLAQAAAVIMTYEPHFHYN